MMRNKFGGNLAKYEAPEILIDGDDEPQPLAVVFSVFVIWGAFLIDWAAVFNTAVAATSVAYYLAAVEGEGIDCGIL